MSIRDNDVLVATLATLKGIFTEGIKEFDLIQLLKAEPFNLFDDRAMSDSLALFQTHFVLFNALYQLQQKWRQENTGLLHIHTSSIVLKPYFQQQAALGQHDPLATYYLDWNNFAKTNAEDVENLLDSFWKRMAGLQNVDESEIERARSVLEIPKNKKLNKTFLKQQFKRLQHLHHPDKGGNDESSKEIMVAYQCLLKTVTQ